MPSGLVVFPIFFQFKSEFGNKEFMIWATVSSWSCGLVFADSIGLLHLWLQKNLISLISVLTIWWYPCVEASLVLLEEGVPYEQCLLLANIFLATFMLHFVPWRPNLPFTPDISWLPTFTFQSCIRKNKSFLVLVLKVLVGLPRTDQLQLLQHY